MLSDQVTTAGFVVADYQKTLTIRSVRRRHDKAVAAADFRIKSAHFELRRVPSALSSLQFDRQP